MAWCDTLISDSAARDCWSLLHLPPETLTERYHAKQDRVVQSGECFDVVQYRDTNVYYQIVDRAFGDGLRLNAVWRDDDGI